MPQEEKSQKPREMVHRAQVKCARWLHRLRRARQGLPDSCPVERAEREWHDAVMLYWEQIKRFRDEENITDEWYNTPVIEDDGEQLTLEDLNGRRLGAITRQTERVNPDTNRTELVTTREPWTMSPQQALRVYDQLDHCAHRLGFDAKATEIRKKFGYQEVDGDDLDTDEFAPQPVEVPDE